MSFISRRKSAPKLPPLERLSPRDLRSVRPLYESRTYRHCWSLCVDHEALADSAIMLAFPGLEQDSPEHFPVIRRMLRRWLWRDLPPSARFTAFRVVKD